MRIVVAGNFPESIISFRGELLKVLVTAGHEVTACAPCDSGDIPERLKLMGVMYRPIKMDRTGTNLHKDAQTFIDFLVMFREIRPDIVLFYTIKPVIYGSIAAWMTGVRNIYSVITGLGYVFIGDSLKQKLLRIIVHKLYRFSLLHNKRVFFLNTDDKEMFESKGILCASIPCIKINGEGIDLKEYPSKANGKTIFSNDSSVDQAALLPEKTEITGTTFLLIARLIRDKGIFEYVEAARILSAKYTHLKFRLVGPLDSNPTAINKKQIDDWQATGAIEYLGETKDVRNFLANADVYVLPSYREGLPRTVLEAMSMGLPIVTTDVPGCRETVSDGDNGFLVPHKDVNALAAAMEKFILQPELVGTMGKRSREIAEDKYDVHKVNAIIMHAMGLANETSP